MVWPTGCWAPVYSSLLRLQGWTQYAGGGLGRSRERPSTSIGHAGLVGHACALLDGTRLSMKTAQHSNCACMQLPPETCALLLGVVLWPRQPVRLAACVLFSKLLLHLRRWENQQCASLRAPPSPQVKTRSKAKTYLSAIADHAAGLHVAAASSRTPEQVPTMFQRAGQILGALGELVTDKQTRTKASEEAGSKVSSLTKGAPGVLGQTLSTDAPACS